MKTETKELAEEVRQYNAWRRGDDSIEMPDPKRLGVIIDEAADRLEQHGNPSDAADPNGSTCARLKWWKDRTDDLHDQIAAKDAQADEIYKAAVDLAKKLEDDLEKERALADRLAHWLSSLEGEGLVPPEWDASAANALAAWKGARRDP
jgi:hypothetical protein